MLNVALPPLSVAVPRVEAPSRNVTVPVGVPEPGVPAVTVAVKVTDWPNTDGFAEDELDALAAALDRIDANLRRLLTSSPPPS